jgi:hypothetical protein
MSPALMLAYSSSREVEGLNYGGRAVMDMTVEPQNRVQDLQSSMEQGAKPGDVDLVRSLRPSHL